MRIGIVGVCAAGKSTLAVALQERGFDARQVSQEHSGVHDLWQRYSKVDVLIYLDVSLEVLRQRLQSPEWPGWLRDAQVQRLQHAREHCDLYIDTCEIPAEEVLARTLAFLAERGHRPQPPPP